MHDVETTGFLGEEYDVETGFALEIVLADVGFGGLFEEADLAV